MLCLSTVYYAWLAYRLAQEDRAHRCLRAAVRHQRAAHVHRHLRRHAADPASRPAIRCRPGKPGLTWVFVQSFVLMVGGFVAPYDPQDHAARGPARLARRHLDHLHLDAARPAQMFMTPVIGVVCFAVILASWFGGVRYFGGMPGGSGRDRRRHGHRLGLEPVRARLWRPERRRARRTRSPTSAFRIPLPAFGHVFARLQISRRDPGDRDPVRHLRSRRGDGQCRERRGRRRFASRPRAS